MTYICEKCGMEFDAEMDEMFFSDLFEGWPEYSEIVEMHGRLCYTCAIEIAKEEKMEATSGQWTLD